MRTRTLATGAALAIAISIGACATAEPPPPEPAPMVYQPDGTLVVANPRSTEVSDFCTLLTSDDLRGILLDNTVQIGRPTSYAGCDFFGGGKIDLRFNTNPIGEPIDPLPIGVTQNSPPTELIAGNAATSGLILDTGCQVIVALDPQPAGANFTLVAGRNVTCQQLRTLAERIVDRLPRV